MVRFRAYTRANQYQPIQHPKMELAMQITAERNISLKSPETGLFDDLERDSPLAGAWQSG